jgi:hypothetical protein
MRLRVRDQPPLSLYSVTRGTSVRVFTAMPVMAGGEVVGVVYASRTPNNSRGRRGFPTHLPDHITAKEPSESLLLSPVSGDDRRSDSLARSKTGVKRSTREVHRQLLRAHHVDASRLLEGR